MNRVTKKMKKNKDVLGELADKKESFDKLLPFLDGVVKEGLINKEKVSIVKYRESD